jgi:hypothetical protein
VTEVHLISGAGAAGGENPPRRHWKIRCTRCGENVGVVNLPVGGLEGWLMGKLVCPSGKHSIDPPGWGLKATIFYPKGGGDEKP